MKEKTARMVYSAWALAVGLAAIALLAVIRINRIGPRLFWASDLCPAPNVTCGVIPLSAFIVALFAAGIAVGGPYVLYKMFEVSGGEADA